MAVTGHKGIDVRETGTRVYVAELLLDSSGAIVTGGTTTLRVLELQSDGTVKGYDFNDDTFKASAITTPTASMTHQQEDSVDLGLWTYILTTLSGFTAGAMYIAYVANSGASPAVFARIFGYGSAEGDLVVTSGRLEVDVTALNGVAGSAANLERSASTIIQGSITGSSTTTDLVDSSLTQSDVDFWKGRIVIFTSGALAGQATDITAFDPGTDTLTVTALTSAPSVADTYVIV